MPLILKPGQSVSLKVGFAPQSLGESTGTISAIAGSIVDIPVAGSGTGVTSGQLSIYPASLNFGSVNLGSTGTQKLTLTANSGSVTVSSVASSNSQFAVEGASMPVTIPAGQSVSVNVGFTPTKSGSASGTLTFSNSGSNASSTDSLAGTGILPTYTVSLSWNASTSQVAGYNVYRGGSAAGPFSRINSTLDANTAYTDTTVGAGKTYYYVATAVDSSGKESAYSAPVEAIIP